MRCIGNLSTILIHFGHPRPISFCLGTRSGTRHRDQYAGEQGASNRFGLETKSELSHCRRSNIDKSKGPVNIKWFEGAQLNLSYNALDRHVAEGRGDRVAFYW